MRILPSGDTAWLVELEDLDEVQRYYAALEQAPPDGTVDIVPAARTILVVTDGEQRLQPVRHQLQELSPAHHAGRSEDLVEVPVVYDGADLDEVADLLDCSTEEVAGRHTGQEWVVAFCGFAPGFAYLTGTEHHWDVPRRSSPRTSVPAGSVGLAGPYSGVYPTSSPGGWQLIGRTELAVFDLDRNPPALLRPGTRVRFLVQDDST